jgi:hypothetical protein
VKVVVKSETVSPVAWFGRRCRQASIPGFCIENRARQPISDLAVNTPGSRDARRTGARRGPRGGR